MKNAGLPFAGSIENDFVVQGLDNRALFQRPGNPKLNSRLMMSATIFGLMRS